MIGSIASTAAATISELEARQAELEAKQAEYQAQLNKSNSAVAEKQGEVDALVGQVESVTAEIQVCYQKISIYDQNIAEKQKAIDAANEEITENMNTLRQRIKTIYISGDVSALEIVMGAKDFSDFLDKLQLVQYVSTHDAELINGIKKKLETISDEKKELEKDKASLEEEHTKLTDKQDELTKLLDENKETLASLQSEAQNAQMQLEISEEELSKLKPELQELVRQSQAAAAQQAAAASSDDSEEISYSDNGSASYSSDAPGHVDSGGGWTWPTPGCYYLTSTFGEARSYESHGAVDIGAPIGTPIYAANSGTVISSSNDCTHSSAGVGGCNHGGGYGNHVWIQHDNGYQTIYGHMISTAVSTGEYVSNGQLIGYVGSTGWSTGPHLHFELRIGGVRSDPMALF